MATGTSVSHYIKNIQKQPCPVNLCIQSEYGGIQTSKNSAYALSHTDSASIFENRLKTMWSCLHFFSFKTMITFSASIRNIYMSIAWKIFSDFTYSPDF